VRDNDSIDVGLMKQFVHALSDFQHNRVRHAFAAKLRDLLRSSVCDFRELWYCFHKVGNFDGSRGVTCGICGGLALARYRSMIVSISVCQLPTQLRLAAIRNLDLHKSAGGRMQSRLVQGRLMLFG
jgi:hypothetical protein